MGYVKKHSLFITVLTTTHILYLVITDGSAAIAMTYPVSASLRVSSFFSWLHLCQDQATCAQPQALDRTNRHKTTESCE